MILQRQVKRALEYYDISHAQLSLWQLMWFEAHQTQIHIVNWSKLDKMTVSKSLKKLVALGYVNRIENETDTRAKSVSLTVEGKEMVRKLIPVVEGIDSIFFGKASYKEQKSLLPHKPIK